MDVIGRLCDSLNPVLWGLASGYSPSADEAETRIKLSASVPLALGTAKERAVGNAKVWLPGALQQNLSDPGLRMGLIASVVLTGGGLHPAQ